MPATRYVIPLNCAYRCEHYTTLTNSEDILNGSVIVAEKEVTLKAGQSLQRRPRLYHKHQGQGPESRPVLTSRGPCIINTQHSRTAGIGRSQLAIGHCIINTQHLRTAGSGRSQLFFKYTTLKKTRALKVGQRTLYYKQHTTLTTTRALKVGQSLRPKRTLKKQESQARTRGSSWHSISIVGDRPARNLSRSSLLTLPSSAVTYSVTSVWFCANNIQNTHCDWQHHLNHSVAKATSSKHSL